MRPCVSKRLTLREKIGADPYLETDATIKESFKWGLCESLVKNDPNYSDQVKAKQLAEEKRVLEEQAQARQDFISDLQYGLKNSALKVRAFESTAGEGSATFWFNTSFETDEKQTIRASVKIGQFQATETLGIECYAEKPGFYDLKIYDKPFSPLCEAHFSVTLSTDTFSQL